MAADRGPVWGAVAANGLKPAVRVLRTVVRTAVPDEAVAARAAVIVAVTVEVIAVATTNGAAGGASEGPPSVAFT
jgi:hypothetical protein